MDRLHQIEILAILGIEVRISFYDALWHVNLHGVEGADFTTGGYVRKFKSEHIGECLKRAFDSTVIPARQSNS